MSAEVPSSHIETVDPFLTQTPPRCKSSDAFFISESVENYPRPLSNEELSNRVFPVDEVGFPLPIYVPEEYRNEDYRKDEHHYWAPRKAMIRQYGDLEKMLRHSRTQYVPVELHRSFTRNFDKTPLPPDRLSRIGHLLLSLARYLPAEAIDVRPSTPEKRELTLEERQIMWANEEIRIKNVSGAQNLLIKYVTKQKINSRNQAVREDVREFLSSNDDDQRVILGRKLFRLAAKAAVKPIEPIYCSAWESGLLPRQRMTDHDDSKGITNTKAIPKHPHLFIARHIIQNEHLERRAISRMRQILESRRHAFA